MAQCADYPDNFTVAECIMAAENAALAEDIMPSEVYGHFADILQSQLPKPAPRWAIRLLFRWRIEAAK